MHRIKCYEVFCEKKVDKNRLNVITEQKIVDVIEDLVDRMESAGAFLNDYIAGSHATARACMLLLLHRRRVLLDHGSNCRKRGL